MTMLGLSLSLWSAANKGGGGFFQGFIFTFDDEDDTEYIITFDGEDLEYIATGDE